MYFAIWRADGGLLKRELADEGAPVETPQFYQSHALQDLTFLARRGSREVLGIGPSGTLIVVGQSMRREFADLTSFGGMLVFAGSITLLVGLLGGWLISARVLRPIAAISATASSISATNLSDRIDASAIDEELTELAAVLNEMFERLQQSFERQARFTADASHELRTPLSILYTNLQLALSRPRSAEEYQETLQSGLKAAARMRNLIDGLLMLARADAGRLDLRPQSVDLGQVAVDVVEQYAPAAQSAGVRLVAEPPAKPVSVPGDSILLARVVSNLVSNALRHTPSGGQVRVTVSADDKSALLTVADTGCGIPLADQARIFERFYRVDTARARSTGGCGLGLAITKSVVEAHQGTIAVTSRPERGASFLIRLPLVAPERDKEKEMRG
jgi:heavy metal sensor kinase